MEAAHSQFRSLGETFVDRGLITPADLESALAEEAATGERLADILVRRGLVTGHDISSALMQQLTYFQRPEDTEPAEMPTGGEQPVDDAAVAEAQDLDEVSAGHEDGFPPAHEGELVLLPPPEQADEPQETEHQQTPEYERESWDPEPAAVDPEPQPTLELVAAEPVSPETLPDFAIDTQALLNDADARQRTAESELAALGNVAQGLEQIKADLDQHQLSSDSLLHELAATHERLRTRETELAAEVARWQQARDEIDRRSQELAEIRAEFPGKLQELSETRATAEAWNARVAELETTIEALRQRAADAVGALDALASTGILPAAPEPVSGVAEAGPVEHEPEGGFEPVEYEHEHDAYADPGPETAAPDSRYLFFVPQDEGYELIECEGTPPAAGETVEVNGGTWVVTNVGESPLPFDDRSCVFLAGP